MDTGIQYWITSGIIIIGYVITAFYQKKQIDSLRATISNFEQWKKMFDIKQVNEYTELIQKSADLKVKAKEEAFLESQKHLMDEVQYSNALGTGMYNAIIELVTYIHPKDRQYVLDHLHADTLYKDSLAHTIKELKDIYVAPPTVVKIIAPFLSASLSEEQKDAIQQYLNIQLPPVPSLNLPPLPSKPPSE